MRNPFPGLRPFREDESHLFFGREKQVGLMLDKLKRTHFLTVVGTSGCGKSSLVNCGLLPVLRAGGMVPGSWRVAYLRPGNDPLRSLARALACDGVLHAKPPEGPFKFDEIVESTLRMSNLGLLDVREHAGLGPDDNLLLIVDQFEELFRYRNVAASPMSNVHEVSDEAIAFVNRLLAVREHPAVPIFVVITMRSDFLGDCAQFAGLPEAIDGGQYLVPRMTREERKRAIEGPIEKAAATISPVLLTRLVNDVGANPDQLSILQHALNRTWVQWEKEATSEPLELRHYESIGTMAHALDQHAEKAYGELSTDREREICANLFKALTDKATDPRGVRRPTTVATLCALTGATQDELEQVMAYFRKPSRAFLMPPAGEPLRPETVIDMSHESLMRVWKRLEAWADEEAQSAASYRRLAETARLHTANRASLWRERELETALLWRDDVKPSEVWAERYAPGFAAAMAFIDASVHARKEEEREAEAERLQVEEMKARYRRRVRVAMSTAGVAIVMSVGMVGYGQFAQKQKQVEGAQAVTRALQAHIAAGPLLSAAQTAVQPYATEAGARPLDNREVVERFTALTQISAIENNSTRAERADVTVEYFRKRQDDSTLDAALRELGFRLTTKQPVNPGRPNCVWYGPDVDPEAVKLVAYALIRAGYDVHGVQPSKRAGVIQVGHSGRLIPQPPLTSEVIASSALDQLRR